MLREHGAIVSAETLERPRRAPPPASWRPGVNVDGVFPLAEHPDGQ
jgi:hypothetical protein